MQIPWKNNVWLLVCALVLTGCNTSVANEDRTKEKPRLGLFSSLPIFWGEGGFGDIIAGTDEPDWVRTELEEDFTLEPLDAIEAGSLEGYKRLLLAQPRPLAPSENVALDDWVAQGGTLVLLADPMLTRHSGYALGDKRRPQDIALLSPILARWGLELRFDDTQTTGERLVHAFDTRVPVNLPGAFAANAAGGVADCTIEAEGLVATCKRGDGNILLLADAALLDSEESGDAEEVRKTALHRLTDSLRD